MKTIVFSIFCLYILSFTKGSKYSQHVEFPDVGERAFRMLKVNQLWEKSQKVLKEPKILADLYAELRVQDKLELELKKLKVDGRDPNGLKDAEVRKRFLDIIRMFNMEEHFNIQKHHERMDNQINDDFPIIDKKLIKLWQQAELSEFSEEERQQLKEEFMHQQMKIDEYGALKNDVQGYEDLEDNELDGEDNFDISMLREKNQDLKSIHRAMRDGFKNLEHQAQKERSEEFTDHRVYQLYALAKKAEMSDKEMESFKEELKHFQHRIAKHEHYNEQMLMAEKAMGGHVKHGEYPERHLELQDRVKDMGYKVKKLHNDLRTTVEKAVNRHLEL